MGLSVGCKCQGTHFQKFYTIKKSDQQKRERKKEYLLFSFDHSRDVNSYPFAWTAIYITKTRPCNILQFFKAVKTIIFI